MLSGRSGSGLAPARRHELEARRLGAPDPGPGGVARPGAGRRGDHPRPVHGQVQHRLGHFGHVARVRHEPSRGQQDYRARVVIRGDGAQADSLRQ